MNIEEQLNFNANKPAVLSIRKSNQMSLIAIGLLRDQVLKKHSTSVPTTLTVLKGELLFELGDKQFQLQTQDVFQVPVNQEHEVKGTGSKNIFILLKVKESSDQ